MPTYRRPHLLPRAIESLRAQTYSDWICEVHNDAPDDDTPAQLLARIGDPRFIYRRHERNLGGTATFNLFFRAAAEPFYSMLEDDNAWEPAFLAAMLDTATRHPDVTVFWSNQSLWQEEPDGVVRSLNATVHPFSPGDEPQCIDWGRPAQSFGAQHAHGSALFRSRTGDDFSTPLVPIALVEAFRERRFPYPLVFVPQPLVRFTRTLATARSEDRAEWVELQTMLAATFLKHARLDGDQTSALFATARARQPPGTGPLLLAGLLDARCRLLLPHVRVAEWLRLFLGLVRHPHVPLRLLHSRRAHGEWWEYLERHTAARFAGT